MRWVFIVLAVITAVCIGIVAFFPEIGLSAPQPTGLILPEDWQDAAEWDEAQTLDVTALPSRWDWNDFGRLQPIRTQRCGDCWAHATTAVSESLARLLHPERAVAVDLSEQAMVSCSREGTCNGGYFSAFNYVVSPGSPAESQMPYQGRQLACPAGLRPAAKLTRWAYVGSSRQAPTTAQLKEAIWTHGPIAVAVEGSFSSYRGGVFTRCGGTSLNHMVVLEGWTDDPAYARNGGGYWKLRNSWGAGWGEAGYMRIAYQSTSGGKCNGVGAVAAYAVMDGVENLRDHISH